MIDLKSERVRQLLESTGAVREGHFLLSSGLHSDRYCQCAALFERPEAGGELAWLMAARLKASGLEADVILAPALGGILWGYALAGALEIRSLFAERPSGEGFELRRGFELAKGSRVILAEDVVTTGKSVSELVPLVEGAGAKVVAFASVVDRSGGTFKPGAPFVSLVELEFQTHKPEECPMCAAGSEPIKPGSRARP